MKISKLLFFSIFLCGCKTYCEKHYPGKEFTTVDTVTRIEKYIDTVFVPYNVVTVDTIVQNIPYDLTFHKTEKKKGLTASLSISKGKITFKCAQDSIQFLLEKERLDHIITKSQLKVQVTDCHKEHKTKFNYFCSYWFWISFGLILLYIIWKAKIFF